MNIKTRVIVAALAGVLSTAALGQEQQPSGEKIDRPFPIIVSRIGDVPFAIPKVWVETKRIDIPNSVTGRTYISLVNLNLQEPPRLPYFSPPPLTAFGIVEPASGLALSNMQERDALIRNRWEQRQVDEEGFWNWRWREFLLVTPTYARPFDQKLIVNCRPSVRPRQNNELACDVHFYWTLATSVQYRFFDTYVPKQEWAALDKQVLDFMKFLDGRESWPPR